MNINKVTYSPTGFAVKNSDIKFGNNYKLVDETVDLAFRNINKVKQSGLRTYLGTTKDGKDIIIEERQFGKIANLTIIDNNSNNDISRYIIKRASGIKSEILDFFSEKNASKDAPKINQHLNLLT